MQAGRHPHFDAAEFSGRIARLRARTRGTRVDVALFDEIEAMTWLSGFGNSENRWRCVGVPLEGEPFFLIRALDASPCRQRTWITDVPTFRDWEDPMPVLALALAKRGLQGARIGLDFGSYCMPVARFSRLREALPDAQFVDLGNVIWELRLTKSPAEIALLRRAAGVADQAMVRAAAACVCGASQRDAAKAAAAAFIELGADPSPPGPISAGRGWDFLHGHLEDRPLAEGDVVHIELTPRVSGYSARLMRCAVVGMPSKELENAAALLSGLQDRQIAAMRPGAIAEDVDAILRHGVIESGLRASFDNISGYTLGFYSHAGPRTSDFTRIFHPGATWRLEPQMVFHMYASAQGASFSETVLVTDQGPERLTRLPRTLIINH
jgi:Xaa-Pro aminopeptidase